MAGVRSRRIRRVAVLIESSRAYGRGLIEGVGCYSRERGNWSISFEPRGLEAPAPWFSNWEGDGVLARFPSRTMAEAVLTKGVPVVDLWGSLSRSQAPMVAGDNARIALLAFEHLWERGIRQFGYCGLAPGYSAYIDLRGEAFRRLAVAAGCPCHMFSLLSTDWASSDRELEQRRIADWLRGSPKPVGVLACYDETGCLVLNACRIGGLRVPEEVAVLGVGNDPVLCDMITPSLSSIDHDAPRIGYEAAACLDRLMRGARPPRRPIRIGPRGLVERRSTDVLAVDDPDVAVALKFIRDHACEDIRVGDVVRHVDVSWSTLGRAFKRLVGRTPKEEILRVQIARAVRLLVESDLALKEVAQRCGFGDQKYFSDAFRRITGSRPTAYRRGHRHPSFMPTPSPRST